MRIVLISTPIGFLGSGKGGGVELTLNSLVSGLLSLGHSVDVIAPKNSKLFESKEKAMGWYNSDAHQQIVGHRRSNTDEKSTFVIAEESSTMK